MTVTTQITSIFTKSPEKIKKKQNHNSGDNFGDFLVENNSGQEDAVHFTNINKMNPFTEIQNLDSYRSDQQKMSEISNDLLKHLNNIRFGLINGELPAEVIHNLKQALSQIDIKLRFPELQKVIDDISLRAEVEIAKIETGKSKINLIINDKA